MKLLVTGAWNCTEQQLNNLRASGHEVVFMQYEKDVCPIAYGDVEGVICNGLFLYHPIEKFTSLRYIQLTSAGFDRVDMDYVNSHGIKIHNAKGVYSIPMAEYALWGALQFTKRGVDLTHSQKHHQWEKQRDAFELFGKTVCIVGCGNVGTECAKRFSAMGCRVVGVDVFNTPRNEYEKIYTIAEKETALSDADFIVLTLPLTDETRGFINEDVLLSLKRNAVIINIARGAVIRTEDLVKSLSDKKIAGAVLDVFEEEPLDEKSPLWDMENVIVTPHNSFIGDGNTHRLENVIMANIRGN